MSGSSRSLLTAIAAVLLAGAVSAGPAAPPKPETPETPEDTANLQPRHKKFLEEVAPLLRDPERQAFLTLTKDYQRDTFIRRFWEVRDPHPQTARNEFRERWEERTGLARERFGNLEEDRARLLLWNGPPKASFQAQCDTLLPVEVWSYDGTDRLKGSFTLIFVSPQGSSRGPFRLWYPSQGIQALLAPEARLRTQDEGGLEQALDRCPRGGEVVGALGLAADWGRIEEKVQLAPDPGTEWLTTFLARSTDLPGGAQPFPAQVDVSFPARYGSRTVMQTLVSVPRQEVQPERLKDSAAYNFVVDGEILYRGELFEQFRYRFNFPEAEAQAATLPMVFQRYLRPGSYTLVLRIEDTGGKRFFREQREMEIPPVEAAGTAVAAAPASAPSPGPAPSSPGAEGALAEANAPSFGSDEQSIRIIAPPPGLMTGKARLEAQTTGDGISKVSFRLNGKPVLTKARPPYSVELNLGDAPRIHTLEAVALAADGRELAQDQILLNSGPQRFSLRLVEPQQGRMYQESLRAQAQVDVPEGEQLDRVEVWFGETLVATLFQPPFVQPILLPPNAGLSYVRAVAYLKDGNSTEDTAVINAPDYMEQMDVDFVELYTTVADKKGSPVEGLTAKDFTVVEDGVPQEVRRFEMVRDLPVYAGILLDTSSSMGENEGQKLDEAVKAGLRFFETVIQPKDRAAVFTFNDTASLAVRFTNQIDVLSAGLNGLTAEGNTALYDSIIYTLYYFGGLKGKKAIVLLSDGQDVGSHYGFNEALDYARRSGVAIYAVGINLQHRDVDVRSKLQRLADETGGRPFFINAATELGRVFESVESELRSQYLLAYQSSKQGGDEKFRTVEVKVSRPGLEAKTIRGYYP